MIIFRGYRRDGKGWVEGAFISNSEKIVEIIDSHNKIVSVVRDSIFTQSGEIVPVYPETLGVSTTKKDPNGNTIFASFEYEDGKISRGGDFVTPNIGHTFQVKITNIAIETEFSPIQVRNVAKPPVDYIFEGVK